MPATMNLLRQTGVLLASRGLVVYWTLRLRRVIGVLLDAGDAAARAVPARLAGGGATAGITVPSWRTYCVMAGVVVRILSCSLASFSTRSGVAWARFSTCSRSRSSSSRRASLCTRCSSVNSWRDRYWVCTR